MGREPMPREPDVALLMTVSGSLNVFLTPLLRMKTFSVIFHLPDYKAISNTRSRINSKKHVTKRKFRHLPLFKIVGFA